MAVAKLGNKVKTNLPDTIRYVINLEKNDGGRLVYASYSSERHDANTLAEPMIRDLERCANGLRKDGVLALHLKHSFSPDEHVSAEQVHELGVMLAEAITGGDYKYVVSTHMDRHHLHNHIVICAANRRTGRKMRLTRRSIDRWRAISDELCRREGLTVLENPKVGIAVVVQEFDGGGVGWYLVCVAVGGDGDASPMTRPRVPAETDLNRLKPARSNPPRHITLVDSRLRLTQLFNRITGLRNTNPSSSEGIRNKERYTISSRYSLPYDPAIAACMASMACGNGRNG